MRTIEEDVPKEIDYLKRHDEAMKTIMNAIEMPDRLTEDLIIFIRQDGGKLARAAIAKLEAHEKRTKIPN